MFLVMAYGWKEVKTVKFTNYRCNQLTVLVTKKQWYMPH